MKSRRRTWWSVAPMVVAIAAAMLYAAPVAAASPTRTVFEPSDPIVFPAGSVCAFEVVEHALPGGRVRITEFTDGRTLFQAHVNAVFTNVETGSTFYHRARFNSTETYDPATNDVTGATTGQVMMWFFPGEVGPSGVVQEPGLLLRFVGRVWYVFDLDTELITAFAYDGTVTDICPLISSL